MAQHNAPYAEAAKVLNKYLLDYQYRHELRAVTHAQWARILGVESPNTIMNWINGMRKPRRAQAVRAAEGLEIEDTFALARAYGYEELSDESGASIPELIAFVAQHTEWSHETRNAIIDRLRRAAQPQNEYDADTIAEMLRKPWPLAIRAQYIAAFADMAASVQILHVA